MKKFGPILLGAAVYMLPSVIAKARNHRNANAVYALNLFTGWTIIGWVIALIWAIYRDPSSF